MTKNDAYKYARLWYRNQTTYQQLEMKMLSEGYNYDDIKLVKDFIGTQLTGK